MDRTSDTLIGLARAGAGDAWARLDALYRPFVHGWFRKHDVPHAEAEDLAQDVLIVVARELPTFEPSGRPGAFRHWLRGITLNRAREYWRACRTRGRATGGTDFQEVLRQVEDPASGLWSQWDDEHDRHVLQQLLKQVAGEVEPKTMQAFRRLALDGAAPEEVAAELSLSVSSVYVAKSRVLRRLRAEAEGLLDEALLR